MLTQKAVCVKILCVFGFKPLTKILPNVGWSGFATLKLIVLSMICPEFKTISNDAVVAVFAMSAADTNSHPVLSSTLE